jgi:phosphopentomutase
VFSRVHDAGGTTALYTTKSKFGLFERSWPGGIGTYRVKENQRRLVALARADLTDGAPSFTFLHVSLPDRYGHAYGGMSDRYLDAVRRTDAQLGTVLSAVAGKDVVVILTADHGFASGETDHSASRNPENFRIPFLVWGSGVEHGDLYELNPDFTDPGATRPSYTGSQPVRNGNVANLALELLGLGSIPGSGIDPEQELAVG